MAKVKLVERSEREILTRQGRDVQYGESMITIRPLVWSQANDFEDAVIDIFTKFLGLTSGVDLDILLGKGANAEEDKESTPDVLAAKKIEQAKGVMVSFLSLLREDLLTLAQIASEDQVNIDTINEAGATKEQVINIVIVSLELNYAHLKNLIKMASVLTQPTK